MRKNHKFFCYLALAALGLVISACGTDEGQEERGQLVIPRGLGKADSAFSCKGHCGSKAPGCYCDDKCAGYGDCCPDKAQLCDKQAMCGGIAGFPCPAGQKCQLDGTYPDAAGKCVPNDYCQTKDDCKFLPAPMCIGDWTCQSNKCAFKCGPGPVTCTENKDCKADEYCEFGDGMCLNPTFMILEGKCAKRPQACTQQYDPVCGCDGKTHSNACMAHNAGASVAKAGECDLPQPKICGPILNGQCDPGYVCDIKSCAIGATGTCAPLPKCDPNFKDPVCACNGTTYNNDCMRRAAGVALDHQGACALPSTKCWTAANCKAGEFCALKAGECLLPTFNILQGTCAKKPQACIQLYEPVCGCDLKTYGNACMAASAGVNVATPGECSTPKLCSSLDQVQCAARTDCEWKTTPGFPGPISMCVVKTAKQYCKGFCGGKAADGCYCDAACSKYGDCCPDYAQVCKP